MLVDAKKQEFNFAVFHLRMVKNTSINRDKNLTFLRINFHNPVNTAVAKDVVLPPLYGRNAIYIKELTVKS